MRFCAALLALLSAPWHVFAQTSQPAPDGSELRVYILTFGPGDDAWEKFGHNAIRIVDPSAPLKKRDVLYNWGTFKFDKSFYWKFVQGRLLYQMSSDPTIPLVEYYAEVLHRTIRQQELNLTPAQKLQLHDLLLQTDTDANRFYLYDYYRNNCTTKIRDVIDQLINGQLAAASKGVPSGASYRFHTDRLDADTLWLYVALEGVLGNPVDRPIDRWQETFLPEKLHDRLNEVMVNIDAKPMPLVKADRVIYQSPRPAQPLNPPHWTLWFFCAGMLLAGLFIGLGRLARRHWAARWAFVIVSLPWLFLMGVGGAIILWAWLFTDHIVARPNENVLHVSILALPLLVLLPRLAFGYRRGAKFARGLSATLVAISLLGILLKALPLFYQVNGVIIALCFPPNLALAYVCWRLEREVATTPQAVKLTQTRRKP